VYAMGAYPVDVSNECAYIPINVSKINVNRLTDILNFDHILYVQYIDVDLEVNQWKRRSFEMDKSKEHDR
jgi:hypothetical protein